MESTLNIAFNEVQSEIGSYLGYGLGVNYGDPAWDTFQQNRIDSATRSGLRNFYFPVAVEGDPASTQWTFLHPVATLTLPSGKFQVDLPDDFGGFESELTVQGGTTTIQPWVIEWRNDAEIYQRFAEYPSATGPPQFIAETPYKGTTGTTSSRRGLVVFPTADQTYTLTVQYYILPDYLTGALPYAYGGAEHAETLLESCLAVAEARFNNDSTIHRELFMQRLQASRDMDRRHKPQKLGLNRDLSDLREDRRSGIRHGFDFAVTYNGVSFDG